MKRNMIHITVLTVGLIAIIIWILELKQGKIPLTDQITRGLVEEVAGTRVYTFFRGMTELGSKSFVIPFVIVMMVVLWIAYKKVFPAIIFGFGTLGASMLNRFIKHLIARERPSISKELDALGFSFPSGHAVTSIVCYGLLAYFLSERFPNRKVSIRIFFGMLIVLIGMSRYFINVHYLTDVITGFFVGYVYVLLLIFLNKNIQARRTYEK